jgi:hypothetical protein
MVISEPDAIGRNVYPENLRKQSSHCPVGRLHSFYQRIYIHLKLMSNKTVLRNLAIQLKRAHRVVLGTLESVANFIYIKKTHKLRDA